MSSPSTPAPTSTATPPAPARHAATSARRALVALAGAGGLLAVNGLTLGPRMMFDPRPYSEIAGTGAHLVHYVVWTVALVALSQIYPRLADVRGTAGRTLPAPVLVLAGAAAALDACARFVLAFVNPFLVTHAPELLDTPPDAVLLVPTLGAGVLAMVATVAFGVAAWRRRVFPRAAVVLLVVGAVAIPAVGPLSNVLVGSGLVWAALAALRRR
ncbi:hypothetical protein [Isoptericola variabilis]|uniref:Integral membrane protein n=1 Tax=Isoptericola variabilis (strain 225) TaxID=743718 RepID=F6FVY7_ISOV2|nr:hypothetical protein [Isoptericola variabilis]AEG44457.1 hypothetical protein Isova_1707 [Isoptericola variabilis 225]TWH28269.1 hypothetical protein L600_004200000070 [Isoptericola variabilis J7]